MEMEINRRDSVCSTSSFLPQWPQKEKKEWLCWLEHYSSHNVIHLCLCSAKASLVYLALWHSPIVLSRHTHTHRNRGLRPSLSELWVIYSLSAVLHRYSGRNKALLPTPFTHTHSIFREEQVQFPGGDDDLWNVETGFFNVTLDIRPRLHLQSLSVLYLMSSISPDTQWNINKLTTEHINHFSHT